MTRPGDPGQIGGGATYVHDPGVDAAPSNAFARRIARMYRNWADKRRMRFDVVEERAGEPYCVTLAISGFAAYPILAGEHGQHVLESPTDGKSFARVRVLVLVAPQPDEPPSGGSTLQHQASRAFDVRDQQRTGVVRRYRDEPSPLVRDSARGWRTGRIDQVLDGDFDLLG
jgi:ATP-dependent Clp protease ATP-binding subunit ClpC